LQGEHECRVAKYAEDLKLCKELVASHEEFFPMELELPLESRSKKSRRWKERNISFNLKQTECSEELANRR
jgi:hypothetical protein